MYCLCVLYVSQNSDFCGIQHWLTAFYNRGGEYLLRGTNWAQPLTREARVRSQASSCKNFYRLSGTRAVLSHILRRSPVSIIHQFFMSPSSTCCSYQKDRWAKVISALDVKVLFTLCSSLKDYIDCTPDNEQCPTSVLLDLTDWEIIVRWTTNPHPLLVVQVSTFTGSFWHVQMKLKKKIKLDELAGCETTPYQSSVRVLSSRLTGETHEIFQSGYCVLRPRFEPDISPVGIVRFTGWTNVSGFTDEISNNLS